MTTPRPPCGVCGGEIPKSLLSDRDWKAELEYIAELNTEAKRLKRLHKPRDFFCSMKCFQIRRDAVTKPEGGRGSKSKGRPRRTKAKREAAA